MKIHIHKNLMIPEIPSEIEIQSGTLRYLLNSLLRPTYFAKEIIDAQTGDLSLDDVFQIDVNSVACHSLPDALDTELRDSDTINLNLIWFGG